MGIEANGVRLQKVIANAGVASRRAAETLMREGRVTVNGAVVSTLGARAHPETDDIRVDGRRVGRGGRRRYLLLNKPRGVVTTRDDPQRRRTVMDFLSGVSESVYPVGRLDYDSAGLLLLTNDGDLAARLTHPRHGLERVYEARVRGVPNASALKRLARGVVLDGRRTAPAIASLVQAGRGLHGNQAVLRICITEGRNRQVRQMCTAIGHPVMRLRRVRIGPIQDQGLRPGQVRDLTPGEVTALRHAVAHSKPAASSQQPGAERSTETNTPRDPVIAIDGPSGAGKGSVSRAVAKALGWRHVDTGAMYRAVAWMATHEGLALDDAPAVTALAEHVELTLDDRTVLVEGHDVTRAIRTTEIDAAAASVARMSSVREALVRRQRAYAAAGGLVMEGRDIGTTVFPAADVKIYLDASSEERAARRAADPAHGLGDATAPLSEVASALEARDHSDRTRKISPLTRAADAVHVDTTGMPLKRVVEHVLHIVRQRLAARVFRTRSI